MTAPSDPQSSRGAPEQPIPEEVAAQRHRLYYRAGQRPVPLLNWNHPDKAKAGKAPLGNDWPDLARRDPPDCLNYPPVQHALNTGILGDGLRIFDVDVDEATRAARVHALIAKRLGSAPCRTRRNSPRFALVYGAATGEPRKVSIAGNLGKIEVLGKGQQLAAFGRHVSGASLEWFPTPLDQVPRDSLPMVTEDQVLDLLMELAPLIEAPPPRQERRASANGSDEQPPGEPQAEIDRLIEALAQIPNEGPPDWERWNYFGMAMWRATGGSEAGFRAWDAWSSRNASYSPQATAARWRHYFSSPPDAVGAGTIFFEAERIRSAGMHALGFDLPGPKAAPGGAGAGPGGNGAQGQEGPQGGAQEGAWGQPPPPPPEPDLSVLHPNRRPPPAFPLDVLGEAWAGWVRVATAAASAPVDYVVGPLLATASALIGNARWAQGAPGWEEPPVLWVASIGDSGSGKSPGGDTLFGKVVPELERRMAREFPDQHRDWETAVQAAKAKLPAWEAAVTAAVKKGEPVPPKPADLDPGPEPKEPRLKNSDVTIEKMAELLTYSSPKGLLMHRDELAGFLFGMNQYNDGARAFHLETYGGRSYRVDRVRLTKPLVVPHMTCAWYGTVQPDRLASLQKIDPDDGFLARFIYLWPEPKPFQPSRQAPDIGFAIEALDRLRALEMHRTAGRVVPIVVPLVSTAEPHLIAFVRAMEVRQRATAGLLNSAYGKVRGLSLRLSLIIEFLRWAAEPIDPFNVTPPIVISEASFIAACQLIGTYLMPMAERAYGDAATPLAERHATVLAKWIVRKRPAEVHIQQIKRHARLPGLREVPAIRDAIGELIEVGWLLPQPLPGTRGRPRHAYSVNPRLWEMLP